jgi:hypothetical protein
MRKANYKGETFIGGGQKLIDSLESIAGELKNNLLSNDKSFLVSEIIKEKNFNRVFIKIQPNFLEHKHYKNEHNGLYAFAIVDKRKVDFQYVGISKTIKKRFGDHVRSKKKNNANWAYLMALNESNVDPILRIPKKQLEMHGMRFTFIHIDNPNLRLIAEVYCANKFKSYWNSFDTH